MCRDFTPIEYTENKKMASFERDVVLSCAHKKYSGENFIFRRIYRIIYARTPKEEIL